MISIFLKKPENLPSNYINEVSVVFSLDSFKNRDLKTKQQQQQQQNPKTPG